MRLSLGHKQKVAWQNLIFISPLSITDLSVTF